MEVHPPDHPIHTWRDLFIHLGVITVGLFIALSLESFVEYIHHRHIVAEARENIRKEIEVNHESAQADLLSLQQNIDLETKNIQAIRDLRTHPKDFHGSVTNTMNFNSMEDAAWRTARDTGALSFMPYDEVQRYSDIYMLENLVNTKAVTTGERDFLAAAPFDMGYDATELPDEYYGQMLHDNAAIKVELFTLNQFVKQLDDQCLAELNKH